MKKLSPLLCISMILYWSCEEEKTINPLIGTWEMRDIERLVETDHHFTYPLKIIDNYLKILIILLLSVHRAKITQVGK